MAKAITLDPKLAVLVKFGTDIHRAYNIIGYGRDTCRRRVFIEADKT
jgi:hypothetical protein